MKSAKTCLNTVFIDGTGQQLKTAKKKKKKKKSTKCPENITIVEGRTMDRNMEKEWTGVTYSELLFTAFIMIPCFYLWFS